MKSKLDAAFARAEQVADDEVRADLARFLCILVSGYLQQSVAELLRHYASTRADTRVQRYVAKRLDATFWNPTKGRIVATLDMFDPQWGRELDSFIVDARAAALGSVLAQRHLIAHGGASDITLGRIKDYYGHIGDIVERVADVLDGA